MKVDSGFLTALKHDGEFDAQMCMNCGTCTALCPLGVDFLPRRLFRSVVLGDRAKVLAEKDAIFECLLCRLCEANCPAGVHIAENVRALRVYVNREVHHLAEA